MTSKAATHILDINRIMSLDEIRRNLGDHLCTYQKNDKCHDCQFCLTCHITGAVGY